MKAHFGKLCIMFDPQRHRLSSCKIHLPEMMEGVLYGWGEGRLVEEVARILCTPQICKSQ